MSNEDLKVGIDMYVPEEKKDEFVQAMIAFTEVKENITEDERNQVNQILGLLDAIATSPIENQLNLVKVLNNQEFKARPGTAILAIGIAANYQGQFMGQNAMSFDDVTIVEGNVVERVSVADISDP
jgi:hypothetical protein